MVVTTVFALPITANAAAGDVVGTDRIAIGDTVYYGHYPQTDLGTVGAIAVPDGIEGVDWVTSTAIDFRVGNQGLHYYRVEPIAWKVLSNAEGKLFLLARDALDVAPYHAQYEDVTWETSTVRAWLNGYGADKNLGTNNKRDGAEGIDFTNNNFLDTAFHAEEQGFIADTAVDNPNNPGYGTSGGNPTNDKIFFLKLQDTINTAFGWPDAYDVETATRRSAPTGYTKAKGAYYDASGNTWWWLRSPGRNSRGAANVDEAGGVGVDGYYVSNAYGHGCVRPAFNLSNLESLLFTSVTAGGGSDVYNAYIKRTITFNPEGGTVLPTTIGVGDGLTIGDFGTLPTPTRTGYTFDGWYTAASGGTLVTSATIVTGNVTYYAHWTRDDILTTTSVPESELAGTIGILQPGQSISLPKSVRFGDGHESDVIWEAGAAGDTGKASVDADGNLIGMAEGTVTLTATSKSDPTKKISIKIMIAKNVTAVRTPVKKLYLVKKKTFTPPVAFDGKDVTGKAWGYGETAKLTWKSSKTSVATVNPTTGKITAKKVGTTKITATALNGKAKVTFTVKVVKKGLKLKKIALTKPPKSLKKGKTAVLKVKLTSARATGVKVSFKSSKPSVLKVDKAGKLYATGKGKAKITVQAGGKRKAITVAVK
jgi:uncharacterized repeat protein (TIGR02543 family)